MRVACLGRGPAGLYFAIAMKLRDPRHDVVVIERNRPDDTFGWGVVLSDETFVFNDKSFYVAHGDGLGPGDHGYKFLKKILVFLEGDAAP